MLIKELVAGGSGIVVVKELNKASGVWSMQSQFQSKAREHGQEVILAPVLASRFLVVAGGGAGGESSAGGCRSWWYAGGLLQ